ncbi:MAG TPA: DUF3052 domain-containing protein [Actinomycetota bacterium]|nr:DUF3052 domain-containing protein [Actinomycetota bacterium]
MADKDYSGTPLAKKLGIREGSRVSLVGPPKSFDLGPLPPGTTIGPARGRLDVVVLFATKRMQVERRFAGLAKALEPDGRLWVAWPKKASAVPTDLDFDVVQEIGLGAGLVDNKSASVDDVFQGVQFVYRLKDRPK